jgi:DNA-binding XRE family transcriptional regulator
MTLTISQIRKKKPAKERTRLQILRDDAGLGTRELARFSEVSSSTISRVESGQCPDIRTALRLARFFETSVEDLFGSFL